MSMKKNVTLRSDPPWEQPKSAKRAKKLSSFAKSSAKKAAAKVWRPYPNLVDNMLAANGSPNKKK